MSSAIPQYLRTHRKRAGLTQSETAALLGLETGENISRYERESRRPTLETAFALQAIFGVESRELFPGLYREVEQGVRKRARALLKERGAKDPELRGRKQAFLEALASAAAEQKAYA